MKTQAGSILRLMFSVRMARPAIKVAALVGTVLNIVNNGEQLWAGQPVDLWHVALNFLVPYCVSSYSAARNEAMKERGD